jgi:uncharacterized phiE125 gp8 family phage protein
MAVLKLKTAPTIEPITRDEVAQHCRIDAVEDDLYIDSLITTAREIIEGLCGPLITQTWEQYEQDFPNGDTLRLWKAHIQSVTSLTYTDVDDTTTTLDADYYTADIINAYQPNITLNYNYCWPVVTLHPVNPIKITFTAGYGASGDYIPKPIKQAMLILISHWYENREPYNISISGNSVVPIPWSADALIAPYRVYGYEA